MFRSMNFDNIGRGYLCNQYPKQDKHYFYHFIKFLCASFQTLLPPMGNHYFDLYYHRLALLAFELLINGINILYTLLWLINFYWLFLTF